MKKNHGIKSSSSKPYKTIRNELARELRNSDIPDEELTGNLGLYIERMHLSRILLMNDLYKRIVSVPGVIFELGVRWGQNMILFSDFRGMYEPYNYTRRIIGFDTFTGFPKVAEQDLSGGPNCNKTATGDYNVSEGWEKKLEKLLCYHETLSPLQHIKKWELIKGDVTQTFDKYLNKNKELVVALAYFDFDIYLPTKHCLEQLIPRLTKGSIVVFDELNCPEFPGETIAVRETLGTHKIKLKRDPNNPYVSWFEWE